MNNFIEKQSLIAENITLQTNFGIYFCVKIKIQLLQKELNRYTTAL